MAELALLLSAIEVTLDGTITVTGIIDSGCQVIIIAGTYGRNSVHHEA